MKLVTEILNTPWLETTHVQNYSLMMKLWKTGDSCEDKSKSCCDSNLSHLAMLLALGSLSPTMMRCCRMRMSQWLASKLTRHWVEKELSVSRKENEILLKAEMLYIVCITVEPKQEPHDPRASAVPPNPFLPALYSQGGARPGWPLVGNILARRTGFLSKQFSKAPTRVFQKTFFFFKNKIVITIHASAWGLVWGDPTGFFYFYRI